MNDEKVIKSSKFRLSVIERELDILNKQWDEIC